MLDLGVLLFLTFFCFVFSRVADPNPDPPDPYPLVRGMDPVPDRDLVPDPDLVQDLVPVPDLDPFLLKILRGLKKFLQNNIIIQNFRKKFYFHHQKYFYKIKTFKFHQLIKQ
jgi:hypothetical protein